MISFRMSLALGLLLTSSVTSMHGMMPSADAVVCCRDEYKYVCSPNYQCINQTHEQFVNDVCHQVPNPLSASEKLFAFRMAISAMPLAYGLLTASRGLKTFVKFGTCVALCTVTCLYAFENYTDGGETAKSLTTFLVTGGNLLLGEYLMRPGMKVVEERV